MQQDEKASFTGRRRERTTSRWVRFMDHFAFGLITIGGIGTILAVFLVLGFLLWSVYPLFQGAEVKALPAPEAPLGERAKVLRTMVDDYGTLALFLQQDGQCRLIRLDTGVTLGEPRLFTNGQLTAWSFPVAGRSIVLGFADGTTRLGEMGFSTTFVEPATLPEELRALPRGARATLGRDMIEVTPEGQFRKLEPVLRLTEPVSTGASNAVVLLDQATAGAGSVLCTYASDGRLRLSEIRQRKNLLTGKTTATVRNVEIPLETPAEKTRPDFLKLAGLGDTIFLIWRDGFFMRLDVRNMNKPSVAETGNLLYDSPGAEVTAVEFLLGNSTLVVGDSKGRIGGWFKIKPAHAGTPDGIRMVRAHDFPGEGAPVVSLSSSARSRIFAAGYADGQVRVFHMTSERLLAAMHHAAPASVESLAWSPKDDGLLALTTAGLHRWAFNARHPEASLRSLFLPVWYEGHVKPAQVWQSSGGTDDFEPKMGLIPLIFGTLKATLYSLIFGVPIALLAAVYTSEFLHPRTKLRIKPLIELMAGLPSVVLGFMAALVFAPFVENWIPSMLLVVVTIPLAFQLGACLWQLIPHRLSLRLTRWRFPVICATLPLGVWAAMALGAPFERWLFAGQIRLWLDGQVGNAVGGWMLLLFPLSGVFWTLLYSRYGNPWLRSRSMQWSRWALAVVDLLKYALGVVLTLGLAWLLSWGLTLSGLDARGAYLGTYVQRNALVVGLVMGFAIIPIIYTIAEDALSTVPQHLRSGSLGAGATPWQTAVRIVIPTAMSGLFSAVMIGLGRAVGETMIVLMAAGNTPIMDWNLFNGFRTLSANIAVEMPEAVKDSTHYRILFLAALTLFAITFVINTVAEIVRLRFRKRAFQM